MFLQSRSKTVFVGVTATFVLASVLVTARVVCRFYIVRRRGWDDYLMLLGWMLAFGMSFAIDFGTSKGLGFQESDIPSAWQPPLLAAEYAAIVVYNPALMAVKSSILVFFIGIARDTHRFLRIGSYVTLAVVITGGIVLTFLTAFQCRPVQAAFDLAVPDARCISIEAIYLASAPVNVATDLAILVMPIPILTGMNLPWRQKAVLVLTFLTGVFVTVFDVMRIYYVQLAATKLKVLTSISITSSLELSYNISFALLWSAVEVNVGIICACIPTLRPLIRLLSPEKGSDRLFSIDDRRPAAAGAADVSWQSAETETREMDFVTTPDMHLGQIAPQPPPQQDEYVVYFGFINMRRPKCMLDTRGWESVKYCAMVITLFFLWGCSSGLLLSLNSVIPFVGIQNPYQLQGIPAANYLGYAFSPFLALWILRHHGFKAAFVTSLGVYCIGTLMFYPSGALKSYPGILIANVLVGFSQSMLQISSGIFITLCGPPQYGESRLLVAEGVATLATLLSSLLSQKVFFVNVLEDPSLMAVQWTYLAIALFTVLLALFVYYMPLPEASDSDLQSQVDRLPIQPSEKILGRFPVVLTTLTMTVLSSVFMSGAGQSVNTFFASLLSDVSTITRTSPSLKTADFYLVGATIYAVSEFTFAFLCLFVPPRILLLLAYTGVTTFSALTMGLNLSSVNDTTAVVLVFAIFEGPIFGLTFAIGLRALGRWTKLGACLITIANGFGSLLFPFVMLAVMQSRTVRYSFCVVVALYTVGALFPLYLNLFRAARHQVDPVALKTTQQGPDSTWYEGPVAVDREVQFVGVPLQR